MYTSADICSDRVDRVAGRRRLPLGVLLGHVVAHELGHVLLGSGSHSPTGIMQTVWHEKQLAAIEQGSLLFTPSNAAALRVGVYARTTAATESARREQNLQSPTAISRKRH